MGYTVPGGTNITPVTPTNGSTFQGLTLDAAPTGGGTRVTGVVNMPVGTNGATSPTTITTGISKAVLAGAVARLIGGPMGTAAAMALPALVDWMHQNGIEPDGNGGLTQAPSPEPGACYTAPCYSYQATNSLTNYSSIDAAGQVYVTYAIATFTNWWGKSYPNISSYTCSTITISCGIGGNSFGLNRESATPSPAPARVPATPTSVENALGGGTNPVPDVAGSLLGAGELLPTNAPILASGPSVVADGIPQVVTTPDSATAPGSTVTTSGYQDVTYAGSTVSSTPRQVITTQPNPWPPGGPMPPATTQEITGKAPTNQNITCGLPTTPPCKIDEAGTPDGKTAIGTGELAAQWAKVDGALPGILATGDKDSSWGLVPYWLGSGGACHPVQIMSFPPKMNMSPLTLDICPHLPVIYTLMNVLWVVWTFGATIAMVLRVTTTAGA